MLINGSAADDQKYKRFELAASKRLSNRWSLLASYSTTKVYIPNVQNTASTGNDFTNPGLQVFLATFDPNAEINSKMNLREWQGRLDGAYILPHDMLVSANFEHRSGAPYARTVSFTGGTQIPSQVVRVEPIGTRRLPNINLLHMRFEKSLRMARGQKVALRVNVFNVTNINTEQSVTQLSGANFLRPAGVIPPRIVEFGVNYTF
jgi:outer membrane receptor protein involved in Fe transport